jgi:hypothetical protein
MAQGVRLVGEGVPGSAKAIGDGGKLGAVSLRETEGESFGVHWIGPVVLVVTKREGTNGQGDPAMNQEQRSRPCVTGAFRGSRVAVSMFS